MPLTTSPLIFSAALVLLAGGGPPQANWAHGAPSIAGIPHVRTGAIIQPFFSVPRDTRAVVLLFVGTECPVANSYAPEIERIRRDYAAKKATLFVIYAEPGLTREAAARHAREYGFGGIALLDADLRWARAAGAEATPEAFVYSLPDGATRYRGRIDDRYPDWGVRRPAATRHDLRLALDAVLAGRTLAASQQRTRAVGCLLPRTKEKPSR